MGGPMMGFTITDPQTPIIKTSNCVLAPTQEEIPEPLPPQTCIRCGACAQVCPMQLLWPETVHWTLHLVENYNGFLLAILPPGAFLATKVPVGTRVWDAVNASGILQKLPTIDLEQQAVGVYGKITRKPKEQLAAQGDRIEIYRPVSNNLSEKE